MRLNHLLALLLTLTAVNAECSSARPVVEIQETDSLNFASGSVGGIGNLRVSVVSDEAKSHQVGIQGLIVCGESLCYRSEFSRVLNIKNASEGIGARVADLAVPLGGITSIEFLAGGANTIEGAIPLMKPLILTKEIASGEVMVVLKRASGGKYVPVAAASNHLRANGQTVLYDPASETTARLNNGVSLSIPAGALKVPTLLNIAIHDIGDDFPLLDIYPELTLLKAAKIQLTAIDRTPRGNSPQGYGKVIKLPPPTASMSPLQENTATFDPFISPSAKTIKILRTGVIRGDSKVAFPEARETLESVTASLASPPNLAACLADLLHPMTPSIITSGLVATGTVIINWCETKAPFIHMTITDLNDSRERFTMRYQPEQSVYGSPMIPLRRITDWSRYTQAMINGFTWTGDLGNLSGQHGKANGFLTIGNKLLGDNRIGGGYGVNGSPGTSSGNKFVFHAATVGPAHSWKEGDFVGFWGTYNYANYLSSSTSIVKNGICSTNTERNSWSAMGSTPSGRIVFISSTSGSQTTAAELCEIFKAVGVTNAMRLDGGSATSMTIDGFLKNPLVGTNSFVFGSSRYIAYALKLSWVGW